MKKIKICGMGDTAIMHQLAQLPVDMLGFIFYPHSPRYVKGKIEPSEIAKLPKDIKKVGVFVNEKKKDILANASSYHLDTLQLHGSESPETCENLRNMGYQIIKTFNLTKENDFDAYAPFCDYFLFDTPSEQHGGIGAKFDWSLLEKYKGSVPFLLSGGIGPNDAEELSKIAHPQIVGIDINSKFEINPGIKDFELIKKFIQTPSIPSKKAEQTLKIELDRKSLNIHYTTNPILFEFAKNNLLNPTDAEDSLWKQISDKKLGVRFKRQHPTLYFIADFYCHQAKLIIEIDGGCHNIPAQHKYDHNRDIELEKLGLKVIHFTNKQILFDIENTLQKIKHEIERRTPNPNNYRDPKGDFAGY